MMVYRTVFVLQDQMIWFTKIILLYYTVIPQGNHQYKAQSFMAKQVFLNIIISPQP